MTTGFEFCAGFPDDLSHALAECPADGVLGDYLPFHEVLRGVDEHALQLLFAAAAEIGGRQRPGDAAVFGAALGDGVAAEARHLDKRCVDLLAAFDDTAIGTLRRAWHQKLGGEGDLDPDLGQGLRGLVIQCRAAVTNGWVVVACEVGG